MIDQVSANLFKQSGKLESRRSWLAMRNYLEQLDTEQLKSILKDQGWLKILFTINKKSARNNIRIFAHTYYSNDLGEPTSIKSSSQMHLDDAWDKWHDLQLEGWTFEELELPESAWKT